MIKFALALVAAPALLIAMRAGAEAPRTLDPAAAAHAREIVEAIMPPDRRDEMMRDMARAVTDQMRAGVMEQFGDPGLRQIVDGHIGKTLERLEPATQRYLPVLTEAMIGAYTREFSGEELAEVARFARTPAGRHYFSRSTSIMSDPAVAAANRTYFAEAQQLSQAGVMELQGAILTYMQKHPEVVRKFSQQPKAPAPQP